MRYLIYFSILLILYYLLTSCQNASKSEQVTGFHAINAKLIPNKRSDTHQLVAKDTLAFELDSLTNDITTCVQYLEVSEKEKYMVFLNKSTQTIYFYTYPQGKIAFTVPLISEGPNGVGKGEKYVFVHNLDSIFVIASHSYLLSIINREGKIINKFSFLSDKSKPFTALPYTGTIEQIIVKPTKNLILCTAIADIEDSKENYKKMPSMYQLDLKTKKYEMYYTFPEPYHKQVYEINFLTAAKTYNPINELIFTSFAADNHIYATDLQSVNQKYRVTSKYFDTIPPMKKVMKDYAGRTKFYLQSPSYEAIFYDKYRDVYYRVAKRAISDEAYFNKDWGKLQSFIILDKDFNIIGESDIGNSIDNDHKISFIAPEGLFVRTPTPDEDKMRFVRFELQKK